MLIEEFSLLELTAKRDSFVFNHEDEELKKLFTGDSLSARLVFSFSLGARKKLKLLKEGFITLALCYITFEEEEGKDHVFGNVLFSPQEDADLYKVYRNLESHYENRYLEKPSRETQKLFNSLFSPLNLTKYLELPKKYTENNLVYASNILFTSNTFMPTKPGLFLVPILYKQSISPYIIPLPTRIFS